MFNKILKLLYICALGMAVSGCSQFWNGPPRVHSVSEEIQALKKLTGLPDFAQFRTLSSDQQKTYRDAYVAERLYGIDIIYSDYFNRVTRERQGTAFAGDIAVIGLNAASTLSGGAATKTVYTVLAGATGAARSDFDKDVMAAQTLQVLLNKMESSRLEIRKDILDGLKLPIDAYPFAAALAHLEDYYRAGTVAGALEELGADAGRKSSDAKEAARNTNDPKTNDPNR